ncbi:outer membrane protein assembly factor BamB [Pantoea sp. SoEX]|uniref:outer membrane protein assembly factor BamB n=1 Tax=Pantoea sp. SoEX TaxID=2576763 RepID=UPI001359E7A5|nr:outer membrane protein assembly factor BamB [Pantoea sp. SoEX]
MLKNYFLFILITLLVGGCSIPGFQKDETHPISLPKVENKITPKEKWNQNIGSGNRNFYTNLHPAYKNNIVYAADRFGIVKAFNVITGKEKWKIDLSEKQDFLSNNSALLSGGITVDENNIYIGSERGILYSLKINDGSIAWKTKLIGEILSSPVVHNDLIFVHTSNGFLQGVDRKNGKINWNFELSNYPLSIREGTKPSIMLDSLIIGDSKGRINAISIKNNQILWRKYISDINTNSLVDQQIQDINISPVIFKGVIYVSSYNGNISALEFASGDILWQRNIGSNIKKLIVNNSFIYIVDVKDRLFSLSVNSGKIIWSQENLIYRQLTSPIIYKNYLVVADMQGYLHWINTEDGQFVAQQKLGLAGFQSEPIVAVNNNNKELLIQNNNGKIYAVVI